jgi:hypothetical protein
MLDRKQTGIGHGPCRGPRCHRHRGWLIASPAAAQQQQQGGLFDFFSNLMKGTPEEEAACRPDVEKYCHDAEPDTFRVLGCLKEQRRRISKKCLAVLESHGQ